MKFKVFILLICILGVCTAYAQDPHISQYFANPLYVNPAFAGASVCPQIGISYRNQWPKYGGGFSTANVSYNQHIDGIRGGIGAYVLADVQGGGTYRNITAAFMYSYRFRLGDKLSLRLAVQGAYVNRHANWDGLTFPDQYDPILGLVRPSTEEGLTNTPMSMHYADFATGFLLYGEHFYVGLSVNHLTRPNEGYLGLQRKPIKYTAHAGGKIYFNQTYTQKRDKRDINLSPNIIYTRQGNIDELNYGCYLNVHPMTMGIWYRHNFVNSDAIILMLGAEHNGISIAYSYDISVSGLKGTGGAHEISLGFKLACPKSKTGRYRLDVVPCPSF